jgi:hypothetical protein
VVDKAAAAEQVAAEEQAAAESAAASGAATAKTVAQLPPSGVPAQVLAPMPCGHPAASTVASSSLHTPFSPYVATPAAPGANVQCPPPASEPATADDPMRTGRRARWTISSAAKDRLEEAYMVEPFPPRQLRADLGTEVWMSCNSNARVRVQWPSSELLIGQL